MVWSKKNLLLLLCYGFGGLFAQTAHVWHHVSTNEGLSSSKFNNYVYQDGFGFTWVSSTAGINRFDGSYVKQYHADPSDPNSIIVEEGIQSEISESLSGDLWFGGSTALSRYNRQLDDFSHFRHLSPSGDTIRELYYWCQLEREGDKEYLYSSAGRYLFLTVNEDFENTQLIDSIFVGNKDILLPRSKRGSFLLVQPDLDEPTIRLRSYNKFKLSGQEEVLTTPREEEIKDVCAGRGQEIWVVTNGGVYLYDTSSDYWKPLRDAKGQAVKGGNAVAFTDHGDLIVSVPNKGVLAFHPTQLEERYQLYDRYRGRVDFARFETTHAYLSDQNVLWLSTESDGVYYTSLNEPKFLREVVSQQRMSNNVLDICEAIDGSRWFLEGRSVIRIKKRDTMFYELPLSGNQFERAHKITVDSSGRAWVSTYKNLYLKRSSNSYFEKFSKVPPTVYPYDPGYNDVVDTGGDSLLISTNALGVIVLDDNLANERWCPTIGSKINTLRFGGDQTMLTSTISDSLIVLEKENGVWTKRAEYEGIGFVNESVYDRQRKLFWVGTFAGLFTIRKSEVGVWELQRVYELEVKGISSMVLKKDVLWFASPGSIGSVDITSGEVAKYTLSDGMQGVEHNLGAGIAYKNGKIAFGGVDGVTVISPDKLKSVIDSPEPVITGVFVSGVEVVLRGVKAGDGIHSLPEVVLPYVKNSLSIRLGTGEFSDPAAKAYRYSFTTSNTPKYEPISDDPLVSLRGIREGSYYLNVMVQNADGIWSAGKRLIAVTILPPWYRTWWAYTLYVLTILGIISAFFWQVLNKEREKSARARAEVQVAETETSILRLQMNPHFIFNSLNSIDEYIMVEEDVMRAHDYLVMFAELMRKILDMSEEPLTRLDREVEMIKGYVEAERMRVGEQLRFWVEQADEVDMIFTWIPTMILQPFVENAIWHGIGDREQGGTITLRFQLNESEQLLRVDVEDNGRGRGNAGRGTKKYTSKALEITQKRMELLNNKTLLAHQASNAPAPAPPKAYFEIEDLKNTDGTATGTRVVLYLPLIYPDYDTSSSD